MHRNSGTGLRFIDSHIHLGDYADPDQIIRLTRAFDGLLVSVGTGASSSARSVSLQRGHPDAVRAFIGAHPSEAEKERELGWLERGMSAAAGVGEVGLDPRYSEVARGSPQTDLFQRQLALAEKAKKPVQVHSRGAERDCLDTLSAFRLKAVLLHWFQGEELSVEANEKGYYASFGPAILVSKKLQRIAKAWDRDRILAESDGPVPYDALGGVSGPSLVPSVVFKLAQLLGLQFDDAARHLLGNTSAFLAEKA